MENPSNRNAILILFAHPALQRSRVNRRLIRYALGLDGIHVHDLYEAYPDFHILVRHEQSLLLRNDIIIWHHPMYWFSTPALLKEWQDLVLVHGWAYGKGGDALKGKKLLSVITTGGRETLFQKKGFHRHTMREFLMPLSQTANVCGMEYLPPFVVHGTHSLGHEDIERHGVDYRAVLTALRDNKMDLAAARELPRLNADLSAIIMK